MEDIPLKAIGYVERKVQDASVKDKSNISDLVLNEELTDGLQGIEDFSHIFVLFWLNKLSNADRQILKVHPRGRKDVPLLGIFATRTQFRPNPIGLTVVELVRMYENRLTVRGLDAFDGTPILDIKPVDSWDIVEEMRLPNWWLRLENERLKKI